MSRQARRVGAGLSNPCRRNKLIPKIRGGRVDGGTQSEKKEKNGSSTQEGGVPMGNTTGEEGDKADSKNEDNQKGSSKRCEAQQTQI